MWIIYPSSLTFKKEIILQLLNFNELSNSIQSTKCDVKEKLHEALSVPRILQ